MSLAIGREAQLQMSPFILWKEVHPTVDCLPHTQGALREAANRNLAFINFASASVQQASEINITGGSCMLVLRRERPIRFEMKKRIRKSEQATLSSHLRKSQVTEFHKRKDAKQYLKC